MAALVMEPPQPPAPRLSVTCDRHPDESFTGFCTSCLRERLQGLEATSTTHRNSTSTISSSLKSIFFKPANPPSSSSSSSAPHQPQLRRCRSFSFSGPRLSASFEPQRRSCDVRGRNTLWALFNQGEGVGGIGAHGAAAAYSSSALSAAAAAAGAGEIEVVEDGAATVEDSFVTAQASGEIDVEERPMKDHIDLESQSKKPPAKDLAGSFWLAASVFSKKLQKWRRKQKLKKMKKHEGSRKNGADSSRRFRETQSEIAVDAFGRRSCDLGPRFSLDAGRISFEDPRYSFDEPRASWDGYLIGGGRSALSRPPPMLSVVEDVPSPVVQRTDGEIPVEEDLGLPGGSAQTKDYYSDSSSRSRRRSLDRSSSVKRPSVEMSETTMPVPNAKVPLDAGADLFRDWSSSSLRDDYSESFGSAFREAPAQKAPPRKKSRRWSKAWSIWGFIHRRSTSGKGNGGSVVDRSFSETWPELQANGCHANGGRFARSNSSASSRGSVYYGNAHGLGGTRRNGLETNGIGKKRRDEFVLERNRSARYSPGNADSGMLRFYLTPMRGSRRGSGKSKPNNSYHSFARSVLQLY